MAAPRVVGQEFEATVNNYPRSSHGHDRTRSVTATATVELNEAFQVDAGQVEHILREKMRSTIEEMKMPRLRSFSFETQIIERYRRRQSSVEESLMEMFLAGVSVRRVEDITEALWGMRVKPREHRGAGGDWRE
ncbi:MAG: transposase [Gemmatales bacterium]